MAAQLIFFFDKFLTILLAPCLVLEKSNTCSNLGSLRICSKRFLFLSLLVVYKNCLIVSAADETGFTLTFLDLLIFVLINPQYFEAW